MAGEQVTVQRSEALFLLENHALGINGTTVTATSEQPTGSLIVENLLSPALDTAYRSGSLAALNAINIKEITVRFRFGRGRSVSAAVLGASNVRVPWKIKLYRFDPVSSPAEFESAFTDPIIRGRMDEFDWLEMPWDLGPDTDDLTLWTDSFRLRSIIVADRTYHGTQWVDLVFNIDDANQGLRFQGDFIQFGTALLAQALQPEINMLLDWELGVEDFSEIRRVESAALRGRHRAKLTTFAFTLGFLGKQSSVRGREEGFRKIFSGWMKKQGLLGPLFVWPEPDHPAEFYAQSMIATATTLPKIAMANLDWLAATGWFLTETE